MRGLLCSQADAAGCVSEHLHHLNMQLHPPKCSSVDPQCFKDEILLANSQWLHKGNFDSGANVHFDLSTLLWCEVVVFTLPWCLQGNSCFRSFTEEKRVVLQEMLFKITPYKSYINILLNFMHKWKIFWNKHLYIYVCAATLFFFFTLCQNASILIRQLINTCTRLKGGYSCDLAYLSDAHPGTIFSIYPDLKDHINWTVNCS